MTGEAEAILAYGVLSLILALYVSSRFKSLRNLQSGISQEMDEQEK